MMRITLQILLLMSLTGLGQAQSLWHAAKNDREIWVDGFLREWENLASLELSPGAPGVTAEGQFRDNDVSLTVKALWDEDRLYMALSWKDDVWDIEEVLRRDAVWVDPQKRRRDRMLFFDNFKFHIRRSDYDYTFWVSPRVGEKGPFSWQRLLEGYRGMERATSAPAMTVRDNGDEVTVELMFSWKDLRLDPKDKKPITLTLLLVDSDLPDRLLEAKLPELKSVTWQGQLVLDK